MVFGKKKKNLPSNAGDMGSIPGQETKVPRAEVCFPTQRSNPGLLHCKWILYQVNHKGSPRILEWVAYPFSRGSSLPRNQIGISSIAGRFFTN